MAEFQIQHRVRLRPYVTLRAGGHAEQFCIASTANELAAVVVSAQESGQPVSILGWGSNVLPSDAGVSGLVIWNRASRIDIDQEGRVLCDAGAGLQDLFLATAQRSLRGFEFAVGIPGTVGGALVSNAGAYRSNVSTYLTELEIIFEGKRQWVSPERMEFSYRDSLLRRPDAPQMVICRVALRLPRGDAKAIYDEAREYQRQRIGKQPPSASAGSFFKNVTDASFADGLADLPGPLKASGVVPAGFLIERTGLRGHRLGGASVGLRHANFLLNTGGATATDIRSLAKLVRSRVFDQFGVTLEEEVLYLGDWSAFDN